MEATRVYLLALGANLFFSTSSMVFSMFARRFSPFWINQFKVVVAIIAFAIAATLGSGLYLPGTTPTMLLVFSGILGLCLGDLFLFRAYATLGAGRALVLYSFQPLLLGIYGHIFLQQGMSSYQFFSIFCMMACLLVFLLERNKLIGRWDIASFMWAFLGIFLDAVGVMLTRSAYEAEPNLDSMLVNFIRCVGALGAFVLLRPKSYFGVWKDFQIMGSRDKSILVTACFFGCFLSLALYLTALKYAHVASLTAIAITGPVWVSLLECFMTKKWPNAYLVTAFAFFGLGFYFMT